MELPIGFYRFHRDQFLNYQFNRWHSLGLIDLGPIRVIAQQTQQFSDYVRGFQELAQSALAANDWWQAAFALRAAEFLLPPSDLAKKKIYQEFQTTLQKAWVQVPWKQRNIPYQGAELHAYHYPATGAPKGRLLTMGGFDSYIEEFTGIWEGLATAGYEILAFEGPGQGGTLREHGLLFDHDYEHPVRAILDHLHWTDVGILGMSMGGYWAARAAAFEPRIKQLIMVPPVYDWLDRTNSINRWLVKVLLPHRGLMNFLIRQKMRLPLLRHAVEHTQFVMQGKDPMAAVEWMLGMNKHHQHPDRIEQDVLLLGGEHDAFQPVKLLEKQATALVNARSITKRIFLASEHADQHCQIGNVGLLIQEVVQWLNKQHATN